MKTFIVTSITTIILISGILLYMHHLDNNTDQFCSYLDTISSSIHKCDWESCNQNLNRLEELWRKEKKILCAFTDHEELDEFDQTLSKLKESVSCRNIENSASYASVLMIIIKRINENEIPAWENVLRHTPCKCLRHNM